ncbi:DUF427-domain-containing protein [Viridothelium virens]|uniref:DUF427-domain-containing protein n=1 Tax=Viridothelium virens TaxID=1048519 RepID=A0A6A6HDI6_VIRVR|nr:DUF427-domain-containing protein [Viridothelium virens]
MPKATAKADGVVVAETDNFEFVEGNVYFPPSSVKREYFNDSSLHTKCPWKGQSSYYNLNINGKSLKDAAWYYPEPFEKATHIKDHVAFDKRQVEITKS